MTSDVDELKPEKGYRAIKYDSKVARFYLKTAQ